MRKDITTMRNNKKRRILLSFILDCSSSTEELVNCFKMALINSFRKISASDEMAGVKIYISISLFNRDYMPLIEVCPIDDVKLEDLNWKVYGCTDIGNAVINAITDGETIYKQWKMDGYEPIHPYYMLVTDGCPDSGEGSTEEQQKKVMETFYESAKIVKSGETRIKANGNIVPDFTFVAVGISGGKYSANIDLLRKLTNHPSHVIEIDASNADDGNSKAYKEIEKTLEDLIEKTTKIAVTPVADQIGEVFDFDDLF